ncbi:UrvD/REP family ATP-dependent DNA helicase [Microcella sp.]|uniref:UrvD/REP family ATP-dependent DNA helicase n=1 Tax=Microcella sp. TaxID=1913979 RepID=UPI0025635406|nr:UrvD/REP family ATP-dependent DNA helicase [Microcella sp.]MBX9472855.1 PD-(D/E)XK nuclease family protein [Microcella sp.]
MTTFDAALPLVAAAPVVLDEAQQRVVDARRTPGAIVLGAPGSGKTTAVVELVAAAVLDDGLDPSNVLVLTPSRRTATLLRDRLALRLADSGNDALAHPAPGALPGPLARSVAAYAFSIVTAAHRLGGLVEPRLLSGADQDADLAELLDRSFVDELLGAAAGPGPAWPDHLGPEVRRLPAFRTELRDAIARLSEHGWSTDQLRTAARDRSRPEWAAIADFVDEYRRILGSSRPGQLDPAELVRAAVGLVRDPVEGMPPAPRLVVLDDAHDATPSGFDLVAALAAQGATVIALGDPDLATNTFRGAEPEALAHLPALLGWPESRPIVLPLVHRHSAAVRGLAADVTQRIGAAAAGKQRRAVASELLVSHENGTQAAALAEPTAADPRAIPPEWGGPLVALEAPNPTRERTLVADLLRERHLLDGVPYGRMAVIVRSGTMVPGIVRALGQAEVPVQSTAAGRPLREHPAARALIRHVDIGVGRSALDAAAATELLLGPLGGLDRVSLRRLRRALRAEELAGEGDRSADELIVDALTAPDRLATIDHRIARRAARLARTLQSIGERHAAGATVDELLWLAWSESHVAEVWRRDAAGFGVAAAEANRALDAVVALFTAAATIVDTVPDATVESFLARVLDSDVGDDLLAPLRGGDAVLVATPSAVAGLEADVVVIAGLTEGVWPNTRMRGSLLGAPLISRVARGLPVDDLDERRLVLDDELRMFALAATRARRQLVVTATAGDDDQPSALFALVREHARRERAQCLGFDTVAGDESIAALDAAIAASGARPVRARSLRRLVGRLRRELVDDGRLARDGDRAEAALALSRLAAERVPGANPSSWWGLLAPSTDAELFAGDETVSLSPSKLEAIEKSPLDWFLDRVAPSETSPAMGIGTIVHWAMETATEPAVDAIWAAIESRWNELVFESPWLAEQQRRLARRYALGVAAYLRDAEAESRGLVAAEQRFEVTVDRARVSGIVDRLEVDGGGGVRIIDLKTGKPLTKQSEIDEHAQLGAYQLAYADGAFDEVLDEVLEGLPHHPGGARLLYVREGKGSDDYREAVQEPLDDEQLDGFRERLRQAVEAIAVAQLTGVRTIDRFDFALGAHRIHRVGPVTGDE